MPICIECGEARANITKVENGVRVLAQCSNCRRPCDTFAELDGVQTFIALVLLHKRAYRHTLFNLPKLLKPLVITMLLGCFLEAYVGVVQTSYLGFFREHHQTLVQLQRGGGVLRSSGGVVGGVAGGPIAIDGNAAVRYSKRDGTALGLRGGEGISANDGASADVIIGSSFASHDSSPDSTRTSLSSSFSPSSAASVKLGNGIQQGSELDDDAGPVLSSPSPFPNLKDTAQILLSQAVAQAGPINPILCNNMNNNNNNNNNGNHQNANAAAVANSKVGGCASLSETPMSATTADDLSSPPGAKADSADEITSSVSRKGRVDEGGDEMIAAAATSSVIDGSVLLRQRLVSINSADEDDTAEGRVNKTVYFIQKVLSRRPSLRLVDVLRQYSEFKLVPFATALPKLFAFELLEFAFLLVVLLWIGSSLIGGGHSSSGAGSLGGNRGGYPTIATTLPAGEGVMVALANSSDVSVVSSANNKMSVNGGGAVSGGGGGSPHPKRPSSDVTASGAQLAGNSVSSAQQQQKRPATTSSSSSSRQPYRASMPSSASPTSTSQYPEILYVLARVLAMSTVSKIGYVLFLVWDMPLYLIALVESYQFIILLTALRGANASFKAAFFCTFFCLAAKYFFRLLMKSLPPFLASVSFQIMVLRA